MLFVRENVLLVFRKRTMSVLSLRFALPGLLLQFAVPYVSNIVHEYVGRVRSIQKLLQMKYHIFAGAILRGIVGRCSPCCLNMTSSYEINRKFRPFLRRERDRWETLFLWETRRNQSPYMGGQSTFVRGKYLNNGYQPVGISRLQMKPQEFL